MRGDNDEASVARHAPLRFTPTCVGTMPWCCSNERSPSVHPHMRGDNAVNSHVGRHIAGSPPHAWGQLLLPLSRSGLATVHPHMRGDNFGAINRLFPALGSPPHAWGQSHLDLRLRLARRFTPTCVGTMCGPDRSAWAPAVHPHMRGDNRCEVDARRGNDGSPPHAWGQFSLQSALLLVSRFTPTCVGTMGGRCGPIVRRPVHPHMRGDNVNP